MMRPNMTKTLSVLLAASMLLQTAPALAVTSEPDAALTEEEGQSAVEGYAYALSYGETEEDGTWWTLNLNGEEVTLKIREGLDVNQRKSQLYTLVKNADGTYTATVLADFNEENPPESPDIITDHKMPDIYDLTEESFTSEHGTCYYTEGFQVYDLTGEGATKLTEGDTVHTIVYYEDGKEHAICGFIFKHAAAVAVDGYAYALSYGETEEDGTWWTLNLNGEVVTLKIREGLDVNQTKSQICTLVRNYDGTYTATVLANFDEKNPPESPDIITDHKMPEIFDLTDESFSSPFGTCWFTEDFKVYDVTGAGATQLAEGDTVHTIIYYEDGKEHAICGFIFKHAESVAVDGYAYALSYGETEEDGTWWTLNLNGEEVTLKIREGLDVNQRKSQLCTLVKNADGTYSATVLANFDEKNPPESPDIITDHKMPEIFDLTDERFSSPFGTCWFTEDFKVYDVTCQGATELSEGDTVHTIIYYEDGKEHAVCGFIFKHAEPVSVEAVEMYRLYNPNSGEHFYTSDKHEKSVLISLGWKDEGTGWMAPSTSSTPVYRLYNPNAGDHHYTTDEHEREVLIAEGWRDEGIGWYSDDNKGTAILRQYNPNSEAGSHNFTSSSHEHNTLIAAGWKNEGTAWYGLKQ